MRIMAKIKRSHRKSAKSVVVTKPPHFVLEIQDVEQKSAAVILPLKPGDKQNG